MEILSQWKCYPNFVRHEPDAVPIHAVSGPFRHHIDAIAYKKEETMLPKVHSMSSARHCYARSLVKEASDQYQMLL